MHNTQRQCTVPVPFACAKGVTALVVGRLQIRRAVQQHRRRPLRTATRHPEQRRAPRRVPRTHVCPAVQQDPSRPWRIVLRRLGLWRELPCRVPAARSRRKRAAPECRWQLYIDHLSLVQRRPPLGVLRVDPRRGRAAATQSRWRPAPPLRATAANRRPPSRAGPRRGRAAVSPPPPHSPPRPSATGSGPHVPRMRVGPRGRAAACHAAGVAYRRHVQRRRTVACLSVRVGPAQQQHRRHRGRVLQRRRVQWRRPTQSACNRRGPCLRGSSARWQLDFGSSICSQASSRSAAVAYRPRRCDRDRRRRQEAGGETTSTAPSFPASCRSAVDSRNRLRSPMSTFAPPPAACERLRMDELLVQLHREREVVGVQLGQAAGTAQSGTPWMMVDHFDGVEVIQVVLQFRRVRQSMPAYLPWGGHSRRRSPVGQPAADAGAERVPRHRRHHAATAPSRYFVGRDEGPVILGLHASSGGHREGRPIDRP